MIDKNDPDYKPIRNGLIIMIVCFLLLCLSAYQHRNDKNFLNEPRRVIIVDHD